MIHHAIFTALGSDRPGLVDEVSQFIFERGGNIEDSRMVNLRGQFAMMVLLGGDEGALARIKGELGYFSHSAQLQTNLLPAQPPQPAPPAMPYRLIASAIDQGGLV